MIFNENRLLADECREISCLICFLFFLKVAKFEIAVCCKLKVNALLHRSLPIFVIKNVENKETNINKQKLPPPQFIGGILGLLPYYITSHLFLRYRMLKIRKPIATSKQATLAVIINISDGT